MPVRVVTEGGSPVRIVTSGGDPVRIVTSGISDPVRVIGGGLALDAPTFVSAEVGTIDASTVVVTFDVDISAPCGDCVLGFTVLVNGVLDAITACIIVGGNTVRLTLTNPVVFGDVVTVSYDSTVGCIMESTGVTDLATFGAQAVTNNLATPWYRAGGAPAPIAAYQPKNATSYAASKINLVNPGTYNAGDGAAFPTWAAATGWTFAGASSQYLTTGLVPTVDQTWSMLACFSGLTTGGTTCVLGIYNSAGAGARFYIYNSIITFVNDYAVANGDTNAYLLEGVWQAAAVLGFAAKTAYLNGVATGGTIPNGVGAATSPIIIGGRNADGVPGAFITGNVYAIAIWDTSVGHAVWIPAVSAAMAAL